MMREVCITWSSRRSINIFLCTDFWAFTKKFYECKQHWL